MISVIELIRNEVEEIDVIVQKKLFGEDKHVEFKAETQKKHEKFLKDIIAFANTSRGKTIVGVEDETGKVVGLGDQNPFKLSDAISNMISDACTPQINMEITPKTVGSETVLEVEVFPGRHRPYYLASVGKENASYICVNGTIRSADERKRKELELEGQKISYDTMQEIGADYNEAAVKQLMQSMYQAALDACLHRSYLDSSSIQVSIYDDRLEVDSPGMLYDGLNVTDALAGKS